MSAGAAERDLQPSAERERLRQAGRRLKQAQERYARFIAIAPLKNEDVKPHHFEEMKASQVELQTAQNELQAAQEEFLDLYAESLRKDSDFITRSHLLDESDSIDR